MGLKPEQYQQGKVDGWLAVPPGTYHYPGPTLAFTAFGALKGIVALLGKIFDSDEIQTRIALSTDEDTESLVRSGAYTHYILLGTRSHHHARKLLAQYSDDFDFSFSPDRWSIFDRRTGQSYSVPDPSQTTSRDTVEGSDYALIEKVIDPLNRAVIIFIGGMWDTGTLAAGTFLLSHRKRIAQRFVFSTCLR
jgi:hypothetical protein